MADPDIIFNVAEADHRAPGCGKHPDPACLCDVDISRTAGIEWKRAPIEFVNVETAEDLVQVWASYVFTYEIAPERQRDPKMPSPNYKPWTPYVGARYAQGAMPFQIHREVCERWDVSPSLKSIQSMALRSKRVA